MASPHSRDGHPMYERVAQLHVSNLDQGFLATLGIRFLALMYQAIDESPVGVLIVAHVSGDGIVGFVSAGGGMKGVYRHMLRHWWRLGTSLLPVLVSPRKIWRIVEILRYGQQTPGAPASITGSLPKIELYSIAVDAAHRGKGYAELLYRGVEQHFRSRGEPAFKIVVGSALTAAHRFYQRMGARVATQMEVHSGEVSAVYVQTLD